MTSLTCTSRQARTQQAALDAGVEIDRASPDGWRRSSQRCGRRETGSSVTLGLLGPVPEFRIRIVRGFARRLVGDQKLHHHLLRRRRARALGLHLHADAGRALAGGGQHPLALDLDHAGAAIAVGPVVRGRRIAQMRDLAALALGDLPDGLARFGFDLLAVEFELDPGHSAASLAELVREIFDHRS